MASTRAQLRRLICSELHMPFHRRMNGSSTITASPTTTSFIDSKLTQEMDEWKNQWAFILESGEVRLITRFNSATDMITLEYPLAAAPTVADEYEIHSIWNAYELHSAINRAIADSYPSFFDVVTDETLIIKEDTLTYSLASLTSAPWIMSKVWLEQPSSVIRGTATAAAAGSLTDTSANFTGANTNWRVSIYGGTGAGQIRTISSITGTTQVNVSVNWTTTPDTTSKYAVWDTSDQLNDWRRVQSVRFNNKETPTLMYFTEPYEPFVGARIRLEYISIPAALSTEAGSTTIPQEFILHKALHYLYAQKVNDNRADRQRYTALAEYHGEQAENYRKSHAYNMPEATMWTPVIESKYNHGIDGNPIGWGGS